MPDNDETPLETAIKSVLGSHVLQPEAYARLALFFLQRGFAKEEQPPSEAYCPQRLAHLAVSAAIQTTTEPQTLHELIGKLIDPFSDAAEAAQKRLDVLRAAEAA